MAENRYHILLGLPEEIAHPDYYQLLGIRAGENGEAAIEEAFKKQMNSLQHLHSPKHKEFIEFLKGEVRKARKVLDDPKRRKEYDGEMSKDAILGYAVSEYSYEAGEGVIHPQAEAIAQGQAALDQVGQTAGSLVAPTQDDVLAKAEAEGDYATTLAIKGQQVADAMNRR